MIQAFLRQLRSDRGRSLVGVLLVLVIACLAVAGAAHASASGDGCSADHGSACAVCDAVLAIGGALVAAPTPGVAAAEPEVREPVPALLVPLVSEPGRLPAPRGPPARS